jgi:hypothetical protein
MIKGRNSPPPERRAAHQISQQPMSFGARPGNCFSVPHFCSGNVVLASVEWIYASEDEFCDLTAAFCHFARPVGNFMVFDLVNLHVPLQTCDIKADLFYVG